MSSITIFNTAHPHLVDGRSITDSRSSILHSYIKYGILHHRTSYTQAPEGLMTSFEFKRRTNSVSLKPAEL